jgi:hypothetical protein
MMEAYCKYSNEESRLKIINFLNKNKIRFDLDIIEEKSLTNRISVEMDGENMDDFLSHSKFKGFVFYEK